MDNDCRSYHDTGIAFINIINRVMLEIPIVESQLESQLMWHSSIAEY